ncbi:hypothetical protein EJ02DRAFT_211181 [Clathrospora elynae]|uniref:Uncharacterized protein n=1 Tax=Clathrospora elynae TaxID=706981 RepID=A0A6A5SLM8_9PLEO|nr:hypothetical protein EJ02DRAFT_211181 [Clathrospora elynae]
MLPSTNQDGRLASASQMLSWGESGCWRPRAGCRTLFSLFALSTALCLFALLLLQRASFTPMGEQGTARSFSCISSLGSIYLKLIGWTRSRT